MFCNLPPIYIRQKQQRNKGHHIRTILPDVFQMYVPGLPGFLNKLERGRDRHCQFEYNAGKSSQTIFSNSISLPGETDFHLYDYSTDISGSISGISLSAGYSIVLGNNLSDEIASCYLRNKNKFEYDNTDDSGTYKIKQNAVLISMRLKYILKVNKSKLLQKNLYLSFCI